MAALVDARCFNHARREAVACCPECQRFFCRECITEHGGRVVCASCLRRAAAAGSGLRRAPSRALEALAAAAAFMLLWVLFYSAGQVLLHIPSSFHEGTLWEDLWQGNL